MSLLTITINRRLEQNFNILSANILPISSLCSKNVRPISQALNDAASAREIDAASIISKRSQASRTERRRSIGSNLAIEGQRRASFEGRSSAQEPASIEVWPLRIIKTVSVEVIEEDAVNVGHDLDRGDSRRMSRQQNWDSYLR
jgi:hypothetical protein